MSSLHHQHQVIRPLWDGSVILCGSFLFLKDHPTHGGMFCLSTLLHDVRSSTNAFIFLLYTSINVSCASFFRVQIIFQPLLSDHVIECFSFLIMQSQQIVTLSSKPNYVFLVSWLHWPWIIFKRLWQVVQKAWNKNLYPCPINLIVLQPISCCLISHLYFQVYIYPQQISLLHKRVWIQVYKSLTRLWWILSRHFWKWMKLLAIRYLDYSIGGLQ
jgi:hypothetical protein